MNEAEIADKISRWLKQPEAEFFMERVFEKQKRTVTALKNNIDLLEIGRNQGQLYILDWILRLREGE